MIIVLKPGSSDADIDDVSRRVQGMGFNWTLNPYMGCAHRCTFCYVRAFEQRSDRPSDDRYGTSIRVKTNIAEVLRKELARSTWQREQVTVGAATDPYQPVEGKYKLTRACLEVFRDAANPFGIITRGPMIVRDIDVLVEASQRADVSVTFSIPTLDEDVAYGFRMLVDVAERSVGGAVDRRRDRGLRSSRGRLPGTTCGSASRRRG